MKALKLLALAALAVCSITPAGAKTWRINPDPTSGAEYHSFAQLTDNIDFAEGDTILCDPGEYGNSTLGRKNITVIGPGYFLGQNEDITALNSAVFSSISLTECSKVMGINCNGDIYPGDNCQVIRCKAGRIWNSSAYSKSNCLIANNYANEIGGYTNSTICGNIIIYRVSNLTNTEFYNNTVVNIGNLYTLHDKILINLYRSNIHDNIIINTSTDTNGSGYPYCNVILDFDAALAEGNSITNNVFSIKPRWANEDFPNNLYCGATIEDTFINTGSMDDKYRLKADSPAIGAASNGGDCGAFGGQMPYVLSGMPSFTPFITNVTIPEIPTNGKISVTLTISTRND